MNENSRLINEITQLANQVSYLEPAISKLNENVGMLIDAIYALRTEVGRANVNATRDHPVLYETKDHSYRTDHGGNVVGPDVDSAMEYVKKLTGECEVDSGQ